jgi:hypothetical protein
MYNCSVDGGNLQIFNCRFHFTGTTVLIQSQDLEFGVCFILRPQDRGLYHRASARFRGGSRRRNANDIFWRCRLVRSGQAFKSREGTSGNQIRDCFPRSIETLSLPTLVATRFRGTHTRLNQIRNCGELIDLLTHADRRCSLDPIR